VLKRLDVRRTTSTVPRPTPSIVPADMPDMEQTDRKRIDVIWECNPGGTRPRLRSWRFPSGPIGVGDYILSGSCPRRQCHSTTSEAKATEVEDLFHYCTQGEHTYMVLVRTQADPRKIFRRTFQGHRWAADWLPRRASLQDACMDDSSSEKAALPLSALCLAHVVAGSCGTVIS
jgi:hypothetical protein